LTSKQTSINVIVTTTVAIFNFNRIVQILVWQSAHQLLLSQGTFTPISIFLHFLFLT